MSKTIFIPDVGEVFTLSEDWQVELPWHDFNLRMLAAFKLTGTKRMEVGRHIKYDSDGRVMRDANGVYQTESVYRNVTVANPIFKDYDGKSTPALVTFPAGTQFLITRMNAGSTGIRLVHLKCMESSKKGIKTKCIRLPPSQLNGTPIA